MIFPNSGFLLVASVVVLISAPRSDAKESEFIVGGVNAKEGELPYQVSLQYNGQHNCGGSILHNCWVLTAAHCVKGFPQSSLSILAGTTKLNRGGVKVAIKKTILHENYTDTFINDIALIRLKDCLPFSKDITPVQLGTSVVGGDYDAIVSGWGYIDQNGKTLTNDLKKLQVTTITNQECSKASSVNMARGNLCTLNGKGKGFCQGDSGGPLVGVKSQMLIGLVSANVPCAQGVPDIYTRISTYVPWIRNKVRYYPITSKKL